MRQIKALVTKERRKTDSCLDNTEGEDCYDLNVLEQKLNVDERRLQEEFNRAVRSSKPEPPQPVGAGIGGLNSGLNLGKLVKLPLLGLTTQKPNFEWSLLSGSHEVARPDIHLQAISTEWE